MNILYSLLKTIRPYNVFLSCITIPIAFTVYSRSTLLEWIKINNNIEILCYGVLVVFFYTSAANTINDIFDIKTDKINKPDRPLASNQLDKKYGIIFFLLFSKLKKINVSEIIYLFLISSIFIIFFILKGEQFYIFRGRIGSDEKM